jgi:Xaa-Pro dipeptidase
MITRDGRRGGAQTSGKSRKAPAWQSRAGVGENTSMPAFTNSEYERRRNAALACANRLGADALIVTSQLHVKYLIGTSCNSLSSPWPQPLVIAPGERPVYLVRLYDEDRVNAQSSGVDVRTFFGGAATRGAEDVLAEILTELGLARSALGLELARADLQPASVYRLQELLPQTRIVDASTSVNEVMDVKSDVEIAAMRRSAALNAEGLKAFFGALRQGATEPEVRWEVLKTLTALGSEMPHVEVVLGANSAMPHAGYAPGAGNSLQPGTPAFIEFSSQVQDCASGLVRTALLGRNADVEALYAVSRAALDMVEKTLRPGVTAGEVDAAVRKVVEGAGRGDSYRHRVGYACNAWIPYGSTPGSIDLSPGNPAVIQPGMAFHTPINLFEKGRFGVGCSDTWLVTANGCEGLSGQSRDLKFL